MSLDQVEPSRESRKSAGFELLRFRNAAGNRTRINATQPKLWRVGQKPSQRLADRSSITWALLTAQFECFVILGRNLISEGRGSSLH